MTPTSRSVIGESAPMTLLNSAHEVAWVEDDASDCVTGVESEFVNKTAVACGREVETDVWMEVDAEEG